MQFRGGMNELMRQASRLQRKVEQAKDAIKDREITVETASGKVSVVMTYDRRLVSLKVDPEFLAAEGLEMAMDASCAAVNQAYEQAGKAMDAELEKVTGGVKLPMGL